MGTSPYAVGKDRCRNCRVCTSFGRQVPSDQRTEPATVIGSGVRDDIAKVQIALGLPAMPASSRLSARDTTRRCINTIKFLDSQRCNTQQYISARHSNAVGGNNSRGPIYNLEVPSSACGLLCGLACDHACKIRIARPHIQSLLGHCSDVAECGDDIALQCHRLRSDSRAFHYVQTLPLTGEQHLLGVLHTEAGSTVHASCPVRLTAQMQPSSNVTS